MKYALIICLCMFVVFIACKEDVVDKTVISGRVFDKITNQGIDNIMVEYKSFTTSSVLGSGSISKLLTVTDSVGYFETMLEIEKDKSYIIIFSENSDTVFYCPNKKIRLERNVDVTLSSQVINGAFSCD